MRCAYRPLPFALCGSSQHSQANCWAEIQPCKWLCLVSSTKLTPRRINQAGRPRSVSRSHVVCCGWWTPPAFVTFKKHRGGPRRWDFPLKMGFCVHFTNAPSRPHATTLISDPQISQTCSAEWFRVVWNDSAFSLLLLLFFFSSPKAGKPFYDCSPVK